MSYRLDINDDSLRIYGLYGTYEAVMSEDKKMIVSISFDTCVNELDGDGEEYLVETGQEWNIPVDNFAELDEFIKSCERERLWNYMHGPVFKIKPDMESGLLYLKGHSCNFVIGEDNNSLYIDESPIVAKGHYYVKELSMATKRITQSDKWWMRDVNETMDMVRNMRCTASITSGGNLQIDYKSKRMIVGQKSDKSYWVNVIDGNDKHIYYKNSWKEVIALLW